MVDNTTIDDLFNLAIIAEQFSEKVYRGLAAKFSAYPEVATFWQLYAEEEVQHAHWLEQIRAAASPEQLSALADPQILKNAQKVLQHSSEHLLASIHNLEEAYRLVVNAETAEGDAVFDFLLEHFSADERARAFIRVQRGVHHNVSQRFPTRFKSAVERQAITV